jgi:type IV fimbrial biogenesis protein FimT
MELAIVIALIGILAAIAVPAFVNWLPNFRLTNAVNHLHAIVQDARLQAVKENGRVAVLLDPDGNGQLDGNYSVFIDDNMNWNLDGGEILLAVGEIRTGVRMTGATFNQFGFNSRGLLVVNRNTITLSNSEGRTKSVTIEVTGNARIN